MTDTLNRRKFLRGSAVVGAAALATPAIAANHTTTLKMQAAWGGGIFLENAQSYVNRVHAMAGSSLKIDLLAVDSVVKTSQMQDAVHRGVLDGMLGFTGIQSQNQHHYLELVHALVGLHRKFWVGLTTLVVKNCLTN